MPRLPLVTSILLAILFAHGLPAQKTPLHKLTTAEIADGWLSLFDGESLYGWRPAAKINWQVTDAAITADAGEVGLLRTTTQFSNYELKLEFKAPPTTNSGVFLHTSPQPKNVETECYELNIAPADNPFPTGSLVKRQHYAGFQHDDQWHEFHVRLTDGKVTVTLDGQKLYEMTDARPLGRGFIGLQHNSGKVAFRNIRLRPLGLDSLFNGSDLTGWNQYPDMPSKFSVQDKCLHVENGRGQLETKQEYGDFVMQLECMTHAKNLNSGVFFRCIPGDVMMGYECQIQNETIDGDPTKPADCGTGGIFRRMNARKVVAKDQAWFAQTIIAEGPHIATWVNGVHVCDWTDTRKPHENPRHGLRVEAGTIMIQGHDPTTDISFRNLRAGEMKPRSR